jgi:beta-lactamase superfamily II metal-dependent hydrolase
MEVKIKVLNVRDGDAILVHLKKASSDLVMVIDGGHKGDYARVIKPELELMLEEAGKEAPDVVVCTHYDQDHIGGLIPLVEEYINGIKQVWVHQVPEAMKEGFSSFMAFQKNDRSNRKLKRIIEAVMSEKSVNSADLAEGMEFAILSIGELQQLLDLVPSNKLRQTFSGQKPIKGWPEIKILGPTEEYFNTLFPPEMSLNEFLIKETSGYLEERKLEKEGLVLEYLADPCAALKTESPDSLTITNRASIIFSIDAEENRFLFTGDAGIGSFEEIPDYEEELKDLHWLKVPHHGSENNMSNALSELMNPEYAFSSGNRHQDDIVLKCFEKKPRNLKVLSTKEGENLEYPL